MNTEDRIESEESILTDSDTLPVVVLAGMVVVVTGASVVVGTSL